MTLLSDLFRAQARTAEATPGLCELQLFDEERAYLRSSVAKRRAEFGTARVLARRVLGELGVAPCALVPREDRSPVWPAGVVGSIAHTTDYCAVVCDRAEAVRSLGLDVETLRPLDFDLATQIGTLEELRFLHGQPTEARERLSLLLFSAKEAFYKCQYPLTRRFLEFQEVQLELDLPRGQFEARVLASDFPRDLARVAGKFVFRADKILCGVELLAVSDSTAER